MKNQITFSATVYRILSRLLVFTLFSIAVTDVKGQLPDSWLQKADFGGGLRHSAVGFSINGKGYIGTGTTGYFFITFYKDFWQFDPLTNSWTQLADFPHPVAYAIGFSILDKGYLGTGSNDTALYDDFWEYDPNLNNWIPKAHCPGKRSDAVGFSVANKGYVGTGLDEMGNVSKDFREYDPVTDSWSQKSPFGGGSRAAAVGFSIGDKGYVGTGFANGEKSDFWEFDPGTDTWTQKADFGGGDRQDAVGFSIGSEGFLGTGRNGTGFRKDFWQYDPLADTWLKKTHLAKGYSGMNRCMATAFSIGNKGYIGTGLSGKHAHPFLDDLWEYTLQCDSPGIIMYHDADADGYGSANDSLIISDCVPAAGYVFDNADCDDANGGINPLATEICNGIDDNCNNIVDEGLVTAYYVDLDGDGFGDSSAPATMLCNNPGSGYSINNDDCNDNDPAIHPLAPTIKWQKSLGGSSYDEAFSIHQTAEGELIVAGYSASNDGDVSGNHGFSTDYWIVKLDTVGNTIWQKCLGGGSLDYANSLQQTNDLGFVVTGLTYSNDGDVSGNHGANDNWTVKIDPSGNLQWQNALGGSGFDEGYSIDQTSDGGFITAGAATSNDGDVSGNHGADDSWIVKLDQSGNLQWQKSLGGSSNDYAGCIRETDDGGFIAAGASFSNDGDVSGNHGNSDYWIVKLDPSGNIQWQKSLGGSGYDYAASIQQTDDGGFIVAGSSTSNDGDVSGNHGATDGWMVRLGSAGNILWQKTLGGGGVDYATDVQNTSDGGFIVAAYSASSDGDLSENRGSFDYWIVKLDSSGNIQWQKSFGGSSYDISYAVEQISDEEFIVAGHTASDDFDVLENHGLPDYWILKIVLFPGGVELCNNVDDNCNGSIDEGLLQTLYADADGDSYGNPNDSTASCTPMPGYVTNGSDCDDNDAAVSPAAIEICDIIDNNCNGDVDEGLLQTFYADIDGDNFGNANDNTLACTLPTGYLTDSTDCDDTNPNVNPAALETPGNGIDDNCDGYIDEFAVGSSINNSVTALSVFPNPTNGEFEVLLQLNGKVNDIATIVVINPLGQEIGKKISIMTNGKLAENITMRNMTQGIYRVTIIVKERLYSTQVVYQ